MAEKYKEYENRIIQYRKRTIILEDDLLEELEQLKYCPNLEYNTCEVFQIHLIIQAIVDKHYPNFNDRIIPEMLLKSFRNEDYMHLDIIEKIYKLGKLHGIKEERAKKQKKGKRKTILTKIYESKPTF